MGSHTQGSFLHRLENLTTLTLDGFEKNQVLPSVFLKKKAKMLHLTTLTFVNFNPHCLRLFKCPNLIELTIKSTSFEPFDEKIIIQFVYKCVKLQKFVYQGPPLRNLDIQSIEQLEVQLEGAEEAAWKFAEHSLVVNNCLASFTMSI